MQATARLRRHARARGADLLAATLVVLLSACATPSAPPAAPGAGATPGAPAAVAPALGWFSKIKVPDGQQPVLKLAARGVQVFRCEQRSGALGWWFRLPEAELLDERGAVAGRHGADFSFELNDGSRLLGRVTASESAPQPEDLRWLLLATRSFGQGALTGVTYVQRVNTRGGMPPARCERAQLNQLLRVDFSADFIFYRPQP